MQQVKTDSLSIKEVSPNESMEGAHFFNTSSFLLNKEFRVQGWQLLKNQNPLAQIFFYIDKGMAISGHQSTFGSFDVSEEVITEELNFFIQQLIRKFKKKGLKKIKIKHFPDYSAKALFVKNVLLNNGFIKSASEINQHIIVDKEKFEDVGNRSEIIRANKCSQLDYKFRVATLDNLPDIYTLLVETLERNGNSPSMTLEKLQSIVKACQNDYFLFTLWNGEKLIAATVSVKINNSIIYNFYHADHLEYRRVSSLTYLIKNIYLYCFNNNFKILDLGISSVNGVLNDGLFNFKKQRGAVSSEKNCFILTL